MRPLDPLGRIRATWSVCVIDVTNMSKLYDKDRQMRRPITISLSTCADRVIQS